MVSTTVGEAELGRVRRDLGRDPLVLVGPTAEAGAVVRGLRAQPQVELLLAPVRFPEVDRGHRLDELVRAHALRDRFRDVVVVVDPATATLLLRVLAPDQLADRGPVTIVGLPRAGRPVAVRRAAGAGVALGLVGGAAVPAGPLLTLVALLLVAGGALALAPPLRHVGQELLLVALITVGVGLVVVASSARFPGGW